LANGYLLSLGKAEFMIQRDWEAGHCMQSHGCLAEVPSCCVVVGSLLPLNALLSDELN